jgi:aspartate/methionine/tyrosine aminotransferase
VLDDPCYFNFQALLRAHRARIVSVPYTPNGPDLARFEQALAEHRPRLYITNAALHNPTGATLAPPVAHRLLTLAAEHGLLIVEDDIFADFESTPAPRLAAFDGLSRVVSIGSFSKTLSAAIRCGYVAARPEWIDALVDLEARDVVRQRADRRQRRASAAGGRHVPAASRRPARAVGRCDGRNDPAARTRGAPDLDGAARRSVRMGGAAGRARCGARRAPCARP